MRLLSLSLSSLLLLLFFNFLCVFEFVGCEKDEILIQEIDNYSNNNKDHNNNYIDNNNHNNDHSNEHSFQLFMQQTQDNLRLGKPNQALRTSQQALEIAATTIERANAMRQIANSLLMFGGVEEALDLFKESLFYYPEDLSIYEAIVMCNKHLQKYTTSDWQLLFQQIKQAKSDFLMKYVDIEESGIFFALHEAAEMCGYYKEAWMYLKQAHKTELKYHKQNASSLSGSISSSRTNAENLIKKFNRQFFPPMEFKIGIKSKVPIFIVGLPRSGSSLLESLLVAHSQISSIGENSLLGQHIAIYDKTIATATKQFSQDGQSDKSKEKTNWQQTIREATNFQANALVKSMKSHVSISQRTDWLCQENDETCYAMEVEQRVPKRIVDKMLGNFIHIGIIHLFFPNAVIINMIRDPLDHIMSILKQHFGDHLLSWANDVQSTIDEYEIYMHILRHFRTVLPPDRILDIRYEDLVQNTENVLRRVITKVGLSWDSDLLVKARNLSYIHTASFLQIRNPIKNSSIGRWRNYSMEPSFRDLREKLKTVINTLQKIKNGLPFEKEINWQLMSNFDYSL